MEKSSNERVEGTLILNISDGFRGVMAPGLKYLALVDDNSSSHGVGWRQFVGQRCML